MCLWHIKDIIVMELSSHFLVGFQTHSIGGNQVIIPGAINLVKIP